MTQGHSLICLKAYTVTQCYSILVEYYTENGNLLGMKPQNGGDSIL